MTIGYHLTRIPKGTLGEISKVQEELSEIIDALNQDNKVMALIELSDLIGAIKAFIIKNYNNSITIQDLERMADATKRSFESGERT